MSTSKLPDRLLGNYALAGSLILHAGFIGLFSAWQWDWTAPEKTPPKIINVKFIPAPPSSRPSEHPATPRSVSGSPAQPREVHSSAITHLKARTPYTRIPVRHPFKKIHRMATPHTIIHPSPLNKRASLLHGATQPRPAPPYMITPASHGSAERVEVRPAPAFNGPPASSTRAVAVASSLSNSRQKFIPKMSPTARARFPNVKGGMTPAALATEPATANLAHLKSRPGPATLKSPTFSTAALVPEAAVKHSSFRKAESPLQASLSGDWVNDCMRSGHPVNIFEGVAYRGPALPPNRPASRDGRPAGHRLHPGQTGPLDESRSRADLRLSPAGPGGAGGRSQRSALPRNSGAIEDRLLSV